MPKHCGKTWIEENILLCIAIIIGVVCFLPMKLHPWGHRQVVALFNGRSCPNDGDSEK